MDNDKEMLIRYVEIIRNYCTRQNSCSKCLFGKNQYCLACQDFDLQRVNSKEEVIGGYNNTIYIDQDNEEQKMLYKYIKMIREHCKEVTKNFTNMSKCKNCAYYCPQYEYGDCKLLANPRYWTQNKE